MTPNAVEQHTSEASPRLTLGQLAAGILDGPLSAAQRAQVVTGVFDDSRKVQPGSIFVAIRGTTTDGRSFIGDAIARGASIIVGEDLKQADQPAFINVADARAALARLAASWYGLDGPALKSFKLLGVSGTNGKTTTAHMTRAILHAAGLRCGMLGSIEYDVCERRMKAHMTTPGPLELARHLRECIDAGGQVAVMEVSSHALSQRRTDGLRFHAAAFTNLTQDHLDYHGTLDAYFQTKARLFTELSESAVAVINRDDPRCQQLARGCRAQVTTYAIERDADISASITRDTIGGTLYRLRLDGVELTLENALVGKHNIYNALAAAGLARSIGVPAEAIERGLRSVRSVPGRLQRAQCLDDVEVFVDYAHTDDALRNVAGVLRPLTRGRLIIVFGCGGDRDRAKRPLMAKAAAEFGDIVIVTSDNPRTEDPLKIIDDILAGFDAERRRSVCVDPDRRRAIYAALADATAGDVVLIAGKGHEDYQICGREKIRFDDVEVAAAAAATMAKQKN